MANAITVTPNDFSDITDVGSKAFNQLSKHYGEDLAAIQLSIEHDAYKQGEERFVRELDRKMANGEFADSKVAHPVISDLVKKLSARLGEWKEGVMGAKGRKHIAIKTLGPLDNDMVAFITIKAVLSSLASPRRKTSDSASSTVQQVARHISDLVQDEAQFGRIRDAEKAHYEKHVARALAKRVGRKYKLEFMKAVESKMLEAGQLSDGWASWSVEDKFHTGVKLMELLIESTNMIKMVRHMAHNTNEDAELVELTDQYVQYFTERAHVLAGFSPIFQPCVVPPRPWTNVKNGGYWSRGRHNPSLVRTRYNRALRRYFDVDMPNVYKAVNTAQSTAWQVNKKVLDVVNQVIAWKEAPVDGMPSVDKLDMPTRPEDIDTNDEALKGWKKAASRIYRMESARQSRRLALEFIVGQANKFADFDAIYFPHNLDWRGRLYAIPTFSPQGNDVTKGLLTFAATEGKPLGEDGARWLAIHGANCAGFDKASLDDRAQWTLDNTDMILSCATNPLDDTRWADQDAPFCFLAFCFEWAGFVAEGNDYVCSLPLAFDATCSGLQHFSAQLRDEIGGKAVNLTDGQVREDIYAIVADKVKLLVNADSLSGTEDETIVKADKKSGEVFESVKIGTKRLAKMWLNHGITRSVTKRSVMTLAYGSKKFGFAEQVRTDTITPSIDKGDTHFTHEDAAQAAGYMAQHIWDSVATTVVAAVSAMEWLQKAAALMAKEVKDGDVLVKPALPISWTTPAGFPVWQEYRDQTSKRLRTLFMGEHNLSLTHMVGEEPTINATQQKSGIAPNFTHSMDASHLQLTVVEGIEAHGITAFALIHDSFGTVPADAGKLYKAVRTTFHRMYSEHDVITEFYNEFSDQLHVSQLEDMPAIPSFGKLNIDEVLLSEFAFS